MHSICLSQFRIKQNSLIKYFANPIEIISFANQFKTKDFARVAELVDALDSKSSFRKKVRVRFPPRVQLDYDN